jgi:hypothetical protein
MASMATVDVGDEQERKKRLKREANRRSAQLSRQRKKAFIEDLKAKNARPGVPADSKRSKSNVSVFS